MCMCACMAFVSRLERIIIKFVSCMNVAMLGGGRQWRVKKGVDEQGSPGIKFLECCLCLLLTRVEECVDEAYMWMQMTCM